MSRMKPGYYRPISSPADAVTVVRTSDALLRRLKRLKHGNCLNWREVALSDDLYGVPPGSLCAMLKNGVVLERWKSRLGIRDVRRRQRKLEQPRSNLNQPLADMTEREVLLALAVTRGFTTIAELEAAAQEY